MKLLRQIFFSLLPIFFLIISYVFVNLINPPVSLAQTCASNPFLCCDGNFLCCASYDAHGNCLVPRGPFPCQGTSPGQCSISPDSFCEFYYGSPALSGSCTWTGPTPPPPPTPTSPPPPPPTPPPPTETPPPPPVTGNARPRYTVARNYPFPCNLTAPGSSAYGDVEFHSLRPYQASPCNPNYEDLALFCGNDLIITDPITITQTFTPDLTNWSWTFEGGPITPAIRKDSAGNIACYFCQGNVCQRTSPAGCSIYVSMCIDHEDCSKGCRNNGDGTATCWFDINRVRNIAIDLEGAYLPIMGFTEPSVGSFSRPDRVINRYFRGSETMDDAQKVNEYVSWYLHSIIGRAEYDPPNPNTEEGQRKIIDFSGPLRRLLSFETQDTIREDQENAAGVERHDQQTVCINALGQPTACPGSFAQRITGTSGAHREYIPFSSTEDRLGRVDIGSYSIQPPLSSDFTIFSSAIIAKSPATLFFAHMQEGSELAQILQGLFAYEGANLEAAPEDWVASTSDFCDLRAVRSNPGDNLFAGELSATVTYDAQVACEFAIPDPNFPGNLCRRLSGDTADCVNVPSPTRSLSCETNYGQVDCSSGQICAEGCTTLVDESACASIPAGPNPGCVPRDWVSAGFGCSIVGSGLCNPEPEFKCVEDAIFGCKPPPNDQINLVQTCPNNVQIAFRTITETPLAEDVWKRLVANPVSVFRRIFPQIEDEEGRPITRLFDMPAATSVIFKGQGVTVAGNPGSGRPANQAELYFPHIGGVHEYFLKCIQKTLRPEGFGEGCISGPEPLAGIGTGECVPAGGIGTGRCSIGAGFCSPSYLSKWFSGCRARQASIICNGESGGNPLALNCSCLSGGTDYSVGLFQLNLLAHCASSAFDWDWGRACTVLDQSLVDQCLERFFDPEGNAEYAAQISNGGANWSPWSVYTVACQSEVDAECP